MTEDGSDLVLDGNAAAGLLQEIFVLEITTAQIRCGACGSYRSYRLFTSVCGANGSSSKVYPLRWHSYEGGPYTARPLA
jgi:hypothetical protein